MNNNSSYNRGTDDMKCKASVEIYSRVVGYYRPVQQWNEGKQEEFKQRKTFKLVEDFMVPRQKKANQAEASVR